MDAISPIDEAKWRRSIEIESIAKQRGPAVLIADPEINGASPLVERLRREGFNVHFAATLSEVRMLAAHSWLHFALTEFSFEDGDAIGVIKILQSSVPGCRTIVHTRSCSLQLAVQATKAGASDVLPKPVDTDFLLSILLDRSVQKGNTHEFPGNPFQLRVTYILDIYAQCGSNASRAARELSMHRRTLQRLVKRSCSLNNLLVQSDLGSHS
ncbi:response regulator transcription factor [Rhizobium mesoamericanum]|uniref:response regulator transcription factor n=1 Tax=Rhizobium mesoamericanum TaxID=1079800 RepID=UPI0006848B11|nr:response regulator [Rhizobium mesoamericanum]